MWEIEKNGKWNTDQTYLLRALKTVKRNSDSETKGKEKIN